MPSVCRAPRSQSRINCIRCPFASSLPASNAGIQSLVMQKTFSRLRKPSLHLLKKVRNVFDEKPKNFIEHYVIGPAFYSCLTTQLPPEPTQSKPALLQQPPEAHHLEPSVSLLAPAAH
ncbi:hypothetical protein LEMLEM_LOCUS19928 [Lemmus lemmus]